MKYKEEVKETLSRIIDIEADNGKGAIKKVKEQYSSQEIILDINDYIDTEIKMHED